MNFPIGEESRGILETHIYYREQATYYEKVGENTYQALRKLNDELCNDLKSDVYAVHHGYISISKLNKKLD